MTASDFHTKPVVPDSVKHLDADVVVEVLTRHGECQRGGGRTRSCVRGFAPFAVGAANLADAAVEMEERRLDLAEKNIYEALISDDSRRRDAASMFTIRNSHRARKRGWITTSTSAAELSVSIGANAPGEIRFR